MPYLLVKHKIEDYAKWKPVYDKHEAMRKVSGAKEARLYRSASNPNEITLLFEWDDFANARKFAESEDLKNAMKQAGVTGPPEVSFLEEIERTSL